MCAKKVLYLGLDPAACRHKGEIHHYPVIRVTPRSPLALDIRSAFMDTPKYTHIIFTSKSAVAIFFDALKQLGLPLPSSHCTIIAVGQSTAKSQDRHGIKAAIIPQEETAEGIVEELKKLHLSDAYLFWPHSSLSRTVLPQFFQRKGIPFRECVIYDTVHQRPTPTPDLATFDEIIFTSPSTVDAFLDIFPALPPREQIVSIGPVTQAHIQSLLLIQAS